MKGQLAQRLNPFKDIFKTGWENRDQLLYAWRILNKGVCDGCALGTSGMRDWTIDGIHLCWIRLNLLRLNTMPAFKLSVLKDADQMASYTEQALRKLGRIPQPLIRRRGEKRFQLISWEDAITLMAEKVRSIDPKELAFYLVSRGTVNETYYVAQKVARFLGSNNIDNSARICHAPSTTALKETIGYAATTCSYKDMIGTDLLVFIGSNPANNQPVIMKYLHLAKKKGTKIAIINAYKEPGMDKYWVPSSIDSALFGTQITDAFFQIKPGGDIAFINGVLKHLIANDWTDNRFIQKYTTDWSKLLRELEKQSFEELEEMSGASRETMLGFARMYARAKSAIFVWSMGITMHRYGVSNVKSIANLALSRGMVGKPKTGLMAIRGHSGVQGGAEVGAVPNQFPGGFAVNKESASRFGALWGFDVPDLPGYFVSDMIDAAHEDKLSMLYCVGSNLFSVLPDSQYVKAALQKIPLRVHHDIVLNQQMFVEPADTVLLLPATTRYEMTGGNTETTTERRIIFNPEIQGARIEGARDEWRVLTDVAKKVKPHAADSIHFSSTSEIRSEIARAVPLYEGIQNLSEPGENFQWGGELLGQGSHFATEDGKAHFAPLIPPQQEIPPGWYQLATRRGKQFNSMEFNYDDPLTGAGRHAIILSDTDMNALDLEEGDSVLLRSDTGEFRGSVQCGPLQPGVVMMHWPEANRLIKRGVTDPVCGIPAYRDSLVQVLPLPQKK